MTIMVFSIKYYKPYLVLPSILLLMVTNIKHVTSKNVPDADQSNVCETEECKMTAARVLRAMDKTTQPCDDFYQFACGGFMEQSIPDHKFYIATIDAMELELKNKLRTVVEKPSEKFKPFVLMKKAYDSCMNTEIIDSDSVKTMKRHFKMIGGWPVLEGRKWNGRKFNWKTAHFILEELGYDTTYFFYLNVRPQMKNSTNNTLHLDGPVARFGVNHKAMMDGITNRVVKAYYEYMVDIAVMFGANKKYAERELKNSLEFEIKLIRKTTNHSEQYNVPMSIKELQKKYKNIPWVEYINKSLKSAGIQVNTNYTIIAANPAFLSELNVLLGSSKKRILANYMAVRIVLASILYVNKSIRDRLWKFAEIVVGLKKEIPRWEQCVDFLIKNMKIAAGAAYVRNFFDEDAKNRAVEIVSEIHNEFDDILAKVEWMDEVTRQHAIEKAQTMIANIGYPDELLDDNKLEEYYADLEIKSDLHLEVRMELYSFSNKQRYKSLTVPVNKMFWADRNVLTVNAFYNRDANVMEFPAAFLSGIFFHKDRPRYMNYGGIGLTVGHEFTHGFDSVGALFEKNENEANWWQNDTYDIYENKTECVTNHYKTYTIPEVGLNLSVEATLSEDISDIGAGEITYLAYKNWLKHNEREKRLPGLEEYSPEQMFWISVANQYCVKYRPEAMREMLLVDTHSPPKFRVLGTVSNNVNFANDFKCPADSKMNLENKCEIW